MIARLIPCKKTGSLISHHPRVRAAMPFLIAMAAAVALLLLIMSNIALGIESPVDFVNLQAGTYTNGQQFSTGNTLPLTGMPWGFNHWAPQTQQQSRSSTAWWYNGNAHEFYWLRCSHQPSPWIGDYGWFLFGPQVGSKEQMSPTFYWEPRSATMKPHLIDATLADHGHRMELAPTQHGAILKMTYGAGVPPNEPKRVCFREATLAQAGDAITGINVKVGQGNIRSRGYKLFFRAEASVPADQEVKVTMLGDGHSLMCFTTTGGTKGEGATMEVRIATSLISSNQAAVSLHRELPSGEGFKIIAARAKAVWNNLLGRVDIADPGVLSEESDRHLRVFYSGLARALSFPRRLDEVDKDGRVVHYSPYSQAGTREFPGPLVTDNGFWDTYRTVYPLLSLLYPDHLGNVIEGWLNAYKEGGWLPSWASPGYRNCMVGTFADVVIGDAIVKDVPGFNLNTAVDALMRDSFEAPPSAAGGAVGKEGLGEYERLGYISSGGGGRHGSAGSHDAVSRTLDYAFSDFAVGRAFEKLKSSAFSGTAITAKNKAKLGTSARTLLNRAYRAHDILYDSKRGLMVPKDQSGNARNSFDPLSWGFGYTEGNAFHHSFPAFAPDRLAKLHGGADKLAQRIVGMINARSDFRPGSYGQQIHEMTEARAFGMGQYMHNNQPVHHILYLLAAVGHRRQAETYIRHVLERGYGIDFFAGDEDNGEQGAWFVLSSLGVFGLTLGTPDMTLGSPLFPHVVVSRPPGGEPTAHAAPLYTKDFREIDTGLPRAYGASTPDALHIVASGTRPGVEHVSAVLLDNNIVKGHSVPEHALQRGGAVLRFVMEGEGWTGDAHKFQTSAKQLAAASSSSTTTTTASDSSSRSNADLAAGDMVSRETLEAATAAAATAAAAEASAKEEANIAHLKEQFAQREQSLRMESQHQRGMAESLQHRLDVLEQHLRVLPGHSGSAVAADSLAGIHSGFTTGTSSHPIKGVDPLAPSMIAIDFVVFLSLMLLMGWGWALGAGWPSGGLWRFCVSPLPPLTKHDTHTV